MRSIKLPTIIVNTKDGNVFTCVIDYNITFEDILNHLNKELKDNLKSVTLGETILYIKKDIRK